MDTITLVLGLSALCLAGVALQARRLGNENRDVAFIGVTAFALGVGSAVASVL
jgi:hypothetical protein